MTLHSTDDGGMTDDGRAISFERNGLLSYEGLRNLYMTVVRDPQMVDRTGLALQLVRRSLMIDAEFDCDDGFGSQAAVPSLPLARRVHLNERTRRAGGRCIRKCDA
jgi:hypothetical protein